MTILAAILDPADNGFDISDLSVIIGMVALISGTTAGAVRWNARRVATQLEIHRVEMEERIKAALVVALDARVQPRNGGGGWSDVATTVKQIASQQADAAADLLYLRGRIDRHIDSHDHNGPHHRLGG